MTIKVAQSSTAYTTAMDAASVRPSGANMTLVALKRYALSCGLLLLPAIAWNFMMSRHLPSALQPAEFWRDIPTPLALAENGLRIAVLVCPFFMPLEIATRARVRALVVFFAGSLVYVASWLALIHFPNSMWSNSLLGFSAPAYTPLTWLLGIALLGDHLFCGTFYRWWMYLALCSLFLVAHISHVVLVFARTH